MRGWPGDRFGAYLDAFADNIEQRAEELITTANLCVPAAAYLWSTPFRWGNICPPETGADSPPGCCSAPARESLRSNEAALALLFHRETAYPIVPRLQDVELPRTIDQLRQAASNYTSSTSTPLIHPN